MNETLRLVLGLITVSAQMAGLVLQIKLFRRIRQRRQEHARELQSREREIAELRRQLEAK